MQNSDRNIPYAPADRKTWQVRRQEQLSRKNTDRNEFLLFLKRKEIPAVQENCFEFIDMQGDCVSHAILSAILINIRMLEMDIQFKEDFLILRMV
jgi:hypothetical protein